MALELTVLGSSGSHTGPGRACAGHLLANDGTRVMLDAGNGATANLQRHMDFADLDAVVVSHRHVDHCIDLVGMFYLLKFHPDGPQQVDLYTAPGVVDLLTGLLSGDSKMQFREVFRVHDIAPGDRFEVGGMDVELFPSIHPVPTLSARIEVGDTVFAYSADSAGGDDLVACARDADLFLCEATWQGDPAGLPDGIHLTATEAGRIAGQAGADRLVLTHLLGTLDRDRSLEEAAATFPGSDVSLADDNLTWTVA
ncbi:MAG: MBL fold metallo-hydrolase [Actinobacteria bacterium]|nr:MBL fold metallo-hydrolase [Actinomycetota bacterium]